MHKVEKFEIQMLNKSKLFFLAMVGISMLVACKKETTVTQNVNSLGTIYEVGTGIQLNGAIPISNQCYLLYGAFYADNSRADGFVMKVDENFNVIWRKNLGGFRDEVITNLTVDNDENILAVGYSSSYPASSDTSSKLVGMLFYTVYLDKNGNKLWQKTIRPNVSGSINSPSFLSNVFCSKNNEFFLVGNTTNFQLTLNGSTWYNSDVFTLGIDNKGNQLWTKRIFIAPIKSDILQNYCYNYDASLCDDGDVLLLIGRIYFDKPLVNLIKTPFTSKGNTNNVYTWKSADMEDIFDAKSNENTCEMKVLNGNKAIITDMINEGYAITDDNGNITQRVKFKREFLYPKITKNNKGAIITGCYKADNEKLYGCWARVDENGNLQNEVYTSFDNYRYGVVFKNAFINSKNEVIVFATANQLISVSGSEYLSPEGILMLRYDLKGNLIKN